MSDFINDLRKVPVLRVLFPFVLGLLLTKLSPREMYHWEIAFIPFLLILLLYLLRLIFSPLNWYFHLFSGLILFFLFLYFGILTSRFTMNIDRTDLHQVDVVVIGKVMTSSARRGEICRAKFECSHYLKDDSLFCFKQNIVVFLPLDSILLNLLPGEVWAFGGEMRAISNRGNTGEFDYQAYMERRNFFYTLFVQDSDDTFVLNDHPCDLKYYPSRIRKRLMGSWDQSNKDVAILSALTLGDKTLLEAETKKSFSEAGAMHLLAVSGLHVGMIWWILDLLIRVPKSAALWRTSKLFLILLILWFYAGITGFSDSVTRSVTMFSLVAFSKTIQRNSNIFSTLLVSAFLLLLLKPSRIDEPGFQLSYIAVFGIITIQPLLSKFYQDKNKIVVYIFDLLSVSIAAQIATLPLVILFFHQFPVYFLLTNLVAIPLVSIILALFVLVSPILLFFPDLTFFSRLLQSLVHALDFVVNEISELPFSVIRNIPFSPIFSVLMIFVIVSMILLLSYKRVAFLILTLSFISFFLASSAFNRIKNIKVNSFSVFNFSKASVLSSISALNRTTFVLYHQENTDIYVEEFIASLSSIPCALNHNYVVDLGQDSLNEYYVSEGLWSLDRNEYSVLLAGECNYQDMNLALENYDWDALVLTRGFHLHPNAFANIDSCITIIGDGSLRSYEVKRLKDLCARALIIETDGIFMFENN